MINFNPRPPCGGRQIRAYGRACVIMISIHVPRAGDDPSCFLLRASQLRFQATSPVRGTTCSVTPSHSRKLFQSTSPVRGTTRTRSSQRAFQTNFNPRPPCGGRRSQDSAVFCFILFQSTSPVRGTTSMKRLAKGYQKDFNPRPPCGGRQQKLPETGSQFRAASAKTGARAGRSWGKRACFARKSRQNAVRRYLGKSEHLPLAPGGQADGGSFRRQTGFIRSSCRAV